MHGEWLARAIWYGVAFVAALIVTRILSLALGLGGLVPR